MKLICIFISFILLNVSADYDAKYKKHVLATNESMLEADTMGLERVIEEVVYEVERHNIFGKLNCMLAVPDCLDVTICIPGSDLRSISDTEKLLDYQDWIGWKIRRAFKMKYPNIDEDLDFRSIDLKDLAQDRRNLTRPALKNIINRVLDGPVEDIPNNAALKGMCTLIGIYMSAKLPTSFIKTIATNTTNHTCTISDGRINKIYKINGGVWGQISENGTVLQRLQDQL
ncbi:uncharacterized protein LOC126844108 [Adelges cooleyi]|uniref:uncharacterized protein LOC126844108 n=1 Tax=Adelges cooleyi TaxID=133065 RepID=UPI00217F8A41|nr:uncharacterized protein LOC126844108 [Adelges cooleyi]